MMAELSTSDLGFRIGYERKRIALLDKKISSQKRMLIEHKKRLAGLLEAYYKSKGDFKDAERY